MRPPGPLPATSARSTSRSRAVRRTRGEANTRPTGPRPAAGKVRCAGAATAPPGASMRGRPTGAAAAAPSPPFPAFASAPPPVLPASAPFAPAPCFASSTSARDVLALRADDRDRRAELDRVALARRGASAARPRPQGGSPCSPCRSRPRRSGRPGATLSPSFLVQRDEDALLHRRGELRQSDDLGHGRSLARSRRLGQSR